MGIDISQLALPKISPSGIQLLDMLSTQEPDFKVMENIIANDPALASTVIKYANSPLYHRQTRVTNLQKALGLLGLKNIRSAVVMAIMRADTGVQNDVDELIWAHSNLISAFCRLIAKKAAPELADDMQFIGLIHDVGMLMLNHHDPAKYKNLITSAQHGENLDLLETQVLGITHDVVAIRVCDHFRFAEDVALVLGSYHAQTSSDESDQVETEIDTKIDTKIGILSLAHHLEPRVSGIQHPFSSTIPYDFEAAKNLLDLDDAFVSELLETVELLT